MNHTTSDDPMETDDFQFQLVLQLPGTDQRDFDLLVQLEDSLTNTFDRLPHFVEGHDFGSGTGNIFIETNDPKEAFAIASRIVNPAEYPALRAGYRSFDEDEYILIWPENADEEFSLI